jgi:uncharacterized protein
MAVVASVSELWVFPVKSMAGTRVDSSAVDAGGLAGDRSWAVVSDSGHPVTAADEPRLREVRPSLVGGELRLDVPGSPAGLDAAAGAEALSGWLGRRVLLEHREGAGFVDVAPVHLVSTRSTADGSHAEDCDACSVAAPRANVVVDLVGSGSEREWLGRSVQCGAVSLLIARRPEHCLGVYADVAIDGLLRVGEHVELR